MESLAEYHKRGNRPRSEGMYYELIHAHYSQILRAKEEGKWVVCYNNLVPSEIFHAMGIIGMFIEGTTAIMTVALKNQDEVFSVAKNLGYAAEICSLTRAVLAVYVSGWVPRPDMVVWSNEPCDNNVKTGHPIMEAYGIPGFYIDCSFCFGERDVEYLAGQLKEAVKFMEGITGERMDNDRLIETLRLQQEMLSLEQQIYGMCRAVPCPLGNRTYQQMISIRRNLAGSREGVDYLSQVLSEVEELVAQGKGAFPEERFRVMTLFPPPNYTWKTLDRMGYEYGVSIVADPLNFRWEDIDWDFSDPYTTLARRVRMHPNSYMGCGPLAQGFEKTAILDAREHAVQGVIWWADTRCRQGCAAIRTVKDTLRKEVGIPTCVIDLDPVDPSSIPEDELQERLESFFELMEDME